MIARLALVVGLVGCGAASERDVHALYASLQVEEARATAAEHAMLEDGDTEACVDACAASDAARSLADRIGERDARVRAEAVDRICRTCRSAP